jgi:hypothetical protein
MRQSRGAGRKGSSSFLKKEPKNFYSLGMALRHPDKRHRGRKFQKFFASFFQKRRSFFTATMKDFPSRTVSRW